MSAEHTLAELPQPNPIKRLKGHARVCYRVSALALWTYGLLIFRFATRATALVSKTAERRSCERIMVLWGKGALKILGVSVHIEGAPPKTRKGEPYFMVANHLSYLDILVFAPTLGCTFVAMKEMDAWPGIGFAVRHMKTIFVDRSSPRDSVRVNAVIEKAIARNNSVMMFPESTTSYGEDVLPFRAALLKTPALRRMPVHYATLTYRRTRRCPDPNAICWVDDTPFRVHATNLLRLPRIEATITFGPKPISHEDRKQLAAMLEDACRSQLPAFRT